MNYREITRRTWLIGCGAIGATALGITGRASAEAARAKAYRGIRYGRAQRCGLAEVVPFTESLIQTERGPVCPQNTDFAFVMGSMAPNRQDEHCQVLSVFTPSRTGRRPVLVFNHGGASVMGGGEVPWYDGDKIAGENDIVFVTLTHRIGALGFWVPPNSSGMSPGTSDQVAALQWVKANIDKFGGDPDNVTMSGQSAGGRSSVILTEWGYGQKLFRRILCISGATRARSRVEVNATARKFDEALGQDIHTASIPAILEAQLKVGPLAWSAVAPDTEATINIDFCGGWTRNDGSWRVVEKSGKDPVPGTPLDTFDAATAVYRDPTIKFARETAAAGRKAYLYEFDWKAPDTGLGTVHTIDLPFILGNREAWKNAPMLKGADWNDIERLGRLMRAQWAAYARTGNPNVDPKVKWTPITATSLPITHLA